MLIHTWVVLVGDPTTIKDRFTRGSAPCLTSKRPGRRRIVVLTSGPLDGLVASMRAARRVAGRRVRWAEGSERERSERIKGQRAKGSRAEQRTVSKGSSGRRCEASGAKDSEQRVESGAKDSEQRIEWTPLPAGFWV